MKQWKWWRIYWTALPLVLAASWLLNQNGLNPWIATIGNLMAFIIGRAVQQTDDKHAHKEG